MFKKEDILEFLTRIIKNSNTNNMEASKESIKKFKEYLMLTTMCEESTINAITNVTSCFEELVNMYKKIGICDLTPIFKLKDENIEEHQVSVPVRKRTFDKPYQEKHYDRYIPTRNDYVSTCGSSSENSYGSSCGSGGSYGSSC